MALLFFHRQMDSGEPLASGRRTGEGDIQNMNYHSSLESVPEELSRIALRSVPCTPGAAEYLECEGPVVATNL